MSDCTGTAATLTVFGESHGPAIGAVVSGLRPGTVIDEAFVARQMDKRRAKGKISTARTETDRVRFGIGRVPGPGDGHGPDPLIENENTRSGDYAKTADLLRPGHADYTAYAQVRRLSGRPGRRPFLRPAHRTVVAAGSISTKMLEDKGVVIATHLAKCAGVEDAPFSRDPETLLRQARQLNEKDFAVLDEVQGRGHDKGHRGGRRRGRQRGRRAGNRGAGPARRRGRTLL